MNLLPDRGPSTRAILLGLASFAAGIAALIVLRDILIPFILSAFCAYLLSPVVVRIQSFGLRRAVAVVLLYLVFIAGMGAIALELIPRAVNEAGDLRQKIPVYAAQTRSAFAHLQERAETALPFVRQHGLFDTAASRAQKVLEGEIAKIPSYAMGLFSLFSLLVLIPILTFFMLLDGGRMVNRMVEYLPARHVETILAMFYEADAVLGRYLRGQMVETVFVGALAMAGLFMLGIDYAVLIGIFAGLSNLVPYLGPLAGGVMAGAVALIQFQSPAMLVKVVILFSIIQFLDNNIIQPLVIGSGVNLRPVSMMFALMAGAQIYGFTGMIFAVPVAGIVKTIAALFLRRRRTVAHLAGQTFTC